MESGSWGGKWRAEAETVERAQELDSGGVHVVNEKPVELDASSMEQDERPG